jgi:phage baseplate assembly protein W
MSTFERDLPGYRYAETHHGDTIQRVAYRELGDANRWPELVWINDLLPPYITDDPQRASDRVMLSGAPIIIPAARAMFSADVDPYKVFDTDCLLRSGLLEAAEDGDFSIISGRENLKQQLIHRIITDKGALLFHPEYGCSVRRLLGVVNGPTAALLAAEYVKAALLSDDRVMQVNRAVARVEGDQIAVDAEIQPISGRQVDLQVSI